MDYGAGVGGGSGIVRLHVNGEVSPLRVGLA